MANNGESSGTPETNLSADGGGGGSPVILRILGEKKKPVYFSTTWYYSYSAWKNKVIEGLRPECARQEREEIDLGLFYDAYRGVHAIVRFKHQLALIMSDHVDLQN